MAYLLAAVLHTVKSLGLSTMKLQRSIIFAFQTGLTTETSQLTAGSCRCTIGRGRLQDQGTRLRMFSALTRLP